MRLLMAALVILAFFKANSAGKEVKNIELTGRNTVIFNEMINAHSTDRLMSGLLGKETLSTGSDVYILIASPGGEVFYSQFIKLYLDGKFNVKLICKFCASGAGYFFGTANNTRYIVKNSELLVHEMYLPRVTARMLQHKDFVDAFITGSDRFDKEMYTKMKKTKAEYTKLIENRDHILVGQEIIKNHLADEIITVTCDAYIKTLAPNTCAGL